MDGDSSYAPYWTSLHLLFSAAVDARWGNRGLFLRPELAPRNLPDDAWEQYFAEKEGAYETLHTSPPPADSLRRVEIMCRFIVKELEHVAKWQAWLGDSQFRGLWAEKTPGGDYRADDLIRDLWAIMRRLDNRAPPPLPTFPCTADAAISAMERAIEWCLASEPAMNQPNPSNAAEQSEGNRGVAAASPQSPNAPAVTREDVLRQLQPAIRKAYLSFQYAEASVGRRLEDREAHNWLHEHGVETDQDDFGELADYELPAFDTWARQLRKARKPLGEQKYTPRAGRPLGRSIARLNELD